MAKIRGVRQRDNTDCGAACLAYIGMTYGATYPVATIRNWARTNANGTSVYGLIKAAGRMCFHAQASRCEKELSTDLKFPLIAHVKLTNGVGHFLVVCNKSGNKFKVMDPALGEVRKMTADNFYQWWSGVIIQLSPNDKFQQVSKPSSLNRIFGLILSHRQLLIAAIICSIVFAIVGLGISVYLQQMVDVVWEQGDMQLLQALSLAMICAIVLLFLTGLVKGQLVLKMSQNIDRQLIGGYFRHVIALPISFHSRMQKGEILSRVNDAVRINRLINEVCVDTLVDILTIAFAMAFMFMYNMKLASMIALFLPLFIVLCYLYDLINRRWHRKAVEADAALDSSFVEALQNIASIKMLNAASFASKRLEEKFSRLLSVTLSYGRRQIYFAMGADLLSRLVILCTLWMGCIFVIDGDMSRGSLVSFFSLVTFFTSPAMALMHVGRTIRESLIAAERFYEITDLETEPGKNLPEPFVITGDIEFRNVSFTYDDGLFVFRNLDLKIPYGKITGIKGANGCGKSTLVALLLRMYEPDEGEIFIGEKNIRQIPLEVLRSHISVVPQSIEIFNASIRQNICLAEEASEQKLDSVITRCGLREFIEQLPDGYGTLLSEQGGICSGGQRQKIGIARALYRGSPILVMDEATASCDEDSERKIMQTIECCKKKENTVIIISHSDNALKICDNIVLL